MFPKISIVIPTYNSGTYIGETLDSIKAQTFADFEIVIADDGSTDDTRTLCEGYDPRIRYLCLDHSGIPAKARNCALDIARGEFVAFLDSDDLWEPIKLERQLALMEQMPEIGMCFSDHSLFGTTDVPSVFAEARTNLARLQTQQVGADAYMITCPSLLEECLLRGPIPLWTGTIMVRRDCLKKVGKFNEEMALDDDTQMWFRLVKACNVAFVDRPLARRRMRPSSISAANRGRYTHLCSLQSLETLDRWTALTEAEQKAVQIRAADIAFGLGYDAFTSADLKEARRWFCTSLTKRAEWATALYLVASLLPLDIVRGLRALKNAFRTSAKFSETDRVNWEKR